eukprot:Opistho-2@22888
MQGRHHVHECMMRCVDRNDRLGLVGHPLLHDELRVVADEVRDLRALARVEHIFRAARKRFRDDHEVAQRRAVVDNVLVAVAHERLLFLTLENVDSAFVDGKPQVLGKRRCPRLQDFKYCRSVERPCFDKLEVCLVALVRGRASQRQMLPCELIDNARTVAEVLWNVLFQNGVVRICRRRLARVDVAHLDLRAEGCKTHGLHLRHGEPLVHNVVDGLVEDKVELDLVRRRHKWPNEQPLLKCQFERLGRVDALGILFPLENGIGDFLVRQHVALEVAKHFKEGEALDRLAETNAILDHVHNLLRRRRRVKRQRAKLAVQKVETRVNRLASRDAQNLLAGRRVLSVLVLERARKNLLRKRRNLPLLGRLLEGRPLEMHLEKLQNRLALGDENARCERQKVPVGDIDLAVGLGVIARLLDQLQVKLVAQLVIFKALCNHHLYHRRPVGVVVRLESARRRKPRVDHQRREHLDCSLAVLGIEHRERLRDLGL